MYIELSVSRGSSMVPACRQAGSACLMHYVYIIQSTKDNSYYTGITTSLERRLKEHNKSDTKTTRSRKPWKLVYSEEFKDRISARAREKYLKSGIGREVRNKLLLG